MKLEKLTAEIYRQLAPNADVRHNQRLPSLSGPKRQCDVVIRERIAGTYDALIIVECRDQRRPVGIVDVDAFAHKIHDVQANAGIMVTTSGYDSGALAQARNCNIQLMTSHEAHDADWQALVGAHVWLHIVRTIPQTVVASANVAGLERELPLSLDTALLDRNHEVLRTVQGILDDWQAYVHQQSRLLRPGPLDLEISLEEPAFVCSGGTIIQVVCLHFRGRIRVTIYPVRRSFGSGQILIEANKRTDRCGVLFSESVDVRNIIASVVGIDLNAEQFDLWAEHGLLGNVIAPLDMERPFVRIKAVVRDQKTSEADVSQ